MYMTLGVGFSGMLALFSAIGGVCGTVLLAVNGRWIASVLVGIGGAVLTVIFARAERNHWKALQKTSV